MAEQLNLRSKIRYAGDYYIEEIKLATIKGNFIDLSALVTSIDIYEDIFASAVTGSITFTDTNNLLGNGPIIGQEVLSLKIQTPQTSPTDRTVIDFTKNHLYVYKVFNTTQINDGTVAVTLSFTTYDLYTNYRTKVSKAYKGEPAEDIVKEIIRDSTILDSKKTLFYEETANDYKYIIPNLRPFDAISMISKKCVSKRYTFSSNYLFYETCFGYHFRTLENLFGQENVAATYRRNISTVKEDALEAAGAPKSQTATLSLQQQMETIRNYKFIMSKDNIMNIANGIYSSNLIVYNWYNKELSNYHFSTRSGDDPEKYKFDYTLDFYFNPVHTNTKNTYANSSPFFSSQMVEKGKLFTQHPESKTYVYSICSDNVNDKNFYELEGTEYSNPYQENKANDWIMRRMSKIKSLESAIKLDLEIYGTTNLQAGDLIFVEIPYAQKQERKTNLGYDESLSGRYLIKKLHHSFQTLSGKSEHVCNMEVIRDDLSTNEILAMPGTAGGNSSIVDSGSAKNIKLKGGTDNQ